MTDMVVLEQLLQGFYTAVDPLNLAWLFGGSLLGTVLGMLPGLGPSTGMALLLPAVLSLRPDTGLIAMAAIYYGAMFGGSRSSILLNVPGDRAAVASCLDGYPLALNGQAEAALAISAIASFIGGLIAAGTFVLVALPIARFSLRFGPPESFCLMVFALAATAAVSREVFLRGMISVLLGLMLATVGLDFQTGIPRFTFGSAALQLGIHFAVVIIGIYGISEILVNLEKVDQDLPKPAQVHIGRIRISLAQWKRSVGPIFRQSPIGILVGVFPGTGGLAAALTAYDNEKRRSRHPEEFGKGAIEGLAAPEAANNACSVGAMIPMMTLGVPGSGTATVMLGALLMMGLEPGPALFGQHPAVAWGVIASLFLGHIVCLVINLPLAGLLVKGLYMPQKVLYPFVLALAFIGVYSINFSLADCWLLAGVGFAGYLMKKFRVPTAPFILASVVGASMESSFRQSLALSDGSVSIFFRSGISNTLLLAALLSLAWPFLSDWRARKKQGKTIDVPIE